MGFILVEVGIEKQISISVSKCWKASWSEKTVEENLPKLNIMFMIILNTLTKFIYIF